MERRQVEGIDTLNSLNSFIKLVQWTIENNSRAVEMDDQGGAFGETWAGQYFEVNSTDTKLCPLFGIAFNDSDDTCPYIVVYFEEEWNQDFYASFQDTTDGETCEASKNEDDEYVEYRMKEDKFQAFAGAPLAEQENMLKEFLDEVLDDAARR